jgi:hypothetical protein
VSNVADGFHVCIKGATPTVRVATEAREPSATRLIGGPLAVCGPRCHSLSSGTASLIAVTYSSMVISYTLMSAGVALGRLKVVS